MTTATHDRPRRSKPQSKGPTEGRDYFSDSCTYTVKALERIGFSVEWFRKARAAEPPLQFLAINGYETEMVHGSDLLAFLRKNPRLLSRE